DIAYQSFIPILVGADNSYQANARLETTARAAGAAGPAFVGAAMKIIGAPFLVLVDAVGYVVCAMMLSRVPAVEDRPRPAASRRLREEVLEGFRFIWNERALRVVACAVILSNFFATAISTLLPVIVLTQLNLGSITLGMVYTAGEVGGLTGALLLT